MYLAMGTNRFYKDMRVWKEWNLVIGEILDLESTNVYIFLISIYFSHSNLMPNFIAKIWSADFFPNFKVAKFEHELEPGDLACT